ncbi:MAG TPA: universal stress protein [Acidimicrobiales bacterium]|jgi:nucleotide-binding universal stress UspA family protein
MARLDENDSSPRDDERAQMELIAATSTTSTVVVGVDGSDTSIDALSWACGEARRLGGRAIAVLVTPIPGSGVLASASPFAAMAASECLETEACLEEELEEKLRSELLAIGESQRVPLTFVHIHGDVAKELLRVAEISHAQLIAVGRSTKPRHRVAGSLSHRLLRHNGTPIIVVVP